MAEEQDRVILYKNEDFTKLYLIASTRRDFIGELKERGLKESRARLQAAVREYDRLSEELQGVASKLAEHGGELDKSLW